MEPPSKKAKLSDDYADAADLASRDLAPPPSPPVPKQDISHPKVDIPPSPGKWQQWSTQDVAAWARTLVDLNGDPILTQQQVSSMISQRVCGELLEELTTAVKLKTALRLPIGVGVRFAERIRSLINRTSPMKLSDHKEAKEVLGWSPAKVSEWAATQRLEDGEPVFTTPELQSLLNEEIRGTSLVAITRTDLMDGLGFAFGPAASFPRLVKKLIYPEAAPDSSDNENASAETSQDLPFVNRETELAQFWACALGNIFVPQDKPVMQACCGTFGAGKTRFAIELLPSLKLCLAGDDSLLSQEFVKACTRWTNKHFESACKAEYLLKTLSLNKTSSNIEETIPKKLSKFMRLHGSKPSEETNVWNALYDEAKQVAQSNKHVLIVLDEIDALLPAGPSPSLSADSLRRLYKLWESLVPLLGNHPVLLVGQTPGLILIDRHLFPHLISPSSLRHVLLSPLGENHIRTLLVAVNDLELKMGQLQIESSHLDAVAEIVHRVTGGVPRLIRAAIFYLRMRFDQLCKTAAGNPPPFMSRKMCEEALGKQFEDDMLRPPPGLDGLAFKADLERVRSLVTNSSKLMEFVLRCEALHIPFHPTASINLVLLKLADKEAVKNKLTILELAYLCAFQPDPDAIHPCIPTGLHDTFRDLLNEPKVPERLRVRLLNSGIRMEYLCCTTICDILAERTTSTDRTLGLAFAFLSGTFVANEKPVDPSDLLCFPKFMSVSCPAENQEKKEGKQAKNKEESKEAENPRARKSHGLALCPHMQSILTHPFVKPGRPFAVQHRSLGPQWLQEICKLGLTGRGFLPENESSSGELYFVWENSVLVWQFKDGAQHMSSKILRSESQKAVLDPKKPTTLVIVGEHTSDFVLNNPHLRPTLDRVELDNELIAVRMKPDSHVSFGKEDSFAKEDVWQPPCEIVLLTAAGRRLLATDADWKLWHSEA